jgi:hypothetical protein
MATPATPANLAVSLVASNCLKLTWDNVAGESGFYLYKSYDGVTYFKVAGLDADELYYFDRSIEADTEYYYKISAYNDDGESALSGAVNETSLARSEKKYWEGSKGPYVYDENALYGDEDEVFLQGFRTTGDILGTLTDLAMSITIKNAPYVTVSAVSGFDSERVLTAGTNIDITDGGAGTTITISLDADGQDAISKKHTRLHDMNSDSDHNSPSGVENNLVDFDANGYPVDDSGLSVADVSDAVSKKHSHAEQTHIVDADGTLADITTKFNDLLSKLETLGFLATS